MTMNIKGVALGAAGALISILVLMEVAAAIIPSAQTAGNTLNGTGIPLGTLFASNGVTFTIVAVGILVAVIGTALAIGKRK